MPEIAINNFISEENSFNFIVFNSFSRFVELSKNNCHVSIPGKSCVGFWKLLSSPIIFFMVRVVLDISSMIFNFLLSLVMYKDKLLFFNNLQ